jgi:hypothetical protein
MLKQQWQYHVFTAICGTLKKPSTTSAWYTAAKGNLRQPKNRLSLSGKAGPSLRDSIPAHVHGEP